MRVRPLFNWLFPALRPLERHLLDALMTALTPEAREIFRRQVSKVNLVQRYNVRESCFYRMGLCRPSWPEADLFPARQLEACFATVQFIPTGVIDDTVRADVSLVKGHLFSIVFDRDPRPFWDIGKIDVRSVTVHLDPMRSLPTEDADLGARPIRMTGWLSDWARKYSIQKLSPPLAVERTKSMIARIDANLPDEYLELVFKTGGFEFKNIAILGISEVHRVDVAAGSYYCLAEVHDRGVIGVKVASKDKEMYYLDYDRNDPIPVDTSFRATIEAIAENRFSFK